MSKCKDLERLRTAQDMERFAKQHGLDWQEGGNHSLIVSPKGKVAVPRHRGDLAIGTRKSIIKVLSLLIAVLVFIPVMVK